MKKTLFVLALAATALFGVMAQEAPKHSEADYKTVYEFFDFIKFKDDMKASSDKMIDMQTKVNPMLKVFRSELDQFMTKYMSYEVIKKDVADIYLKYFTADDIRELTKFYQTPLGQKFLKANTRMTEDIMELTTNIVLVNQPELQKMITEKAQKMDPAELQKMIMENAQKTNQNNTKTE